MLESLDTDAVLIKDINEYRKWATKILGLFNWDSVSDKKFLDRFGHPKSYPFMLIGRHTSGMGGQCLHRVYISSEPDNYYFYDPQ